LSELRCSIVIPARNENESIKLVINRIIEIIDFNFECIVVVDKEDDSTIHSIVELGLPNIRVVVSSNEPGPAGAIKYGIHESKCNVVVVTMADGSDDPKAIPDLVRLVERGVVIAAASRYMPGGQQIGAPILKSFLSRFAGTTLWLFRRVGTRDATNSFKAYNKKFIEEVGIDSKFGFEIALELVAKAKRHNQPVAEVPTIWLERNIGNSNFKLWNWLPRYINWYLYAFGIGKGKT
jgi:dolichol-phosphate mannosyltransferase